MKIHAFDIPEPYPRLHNTCALTMLSPWVDVGRVGTITLNRIEEHLGAKELGRLSRPGRFFDFTRYRPYMRNVDEKRVFIIPNSVVFYANDSNTGRDYLFMHMHEPHANSEDYIDSVLALFDHFEVTEYCRVGGMYDAVPHTRPLMVTDSLSEAKSKKAQHLLSPSKRSYQGPTTIFNVVNEELIRKGVETSSLMVHLPQYVQLEEDHLGASRLLEVLCTLYGFPTKLADQTAGQLQYENVDRTLATSLEIKLLIKQLETDYDNMIENSKSQNEHPLPPDVEKFLREIGKRLETDQEGH